MTKKLSQEITTTEESRIEVPDDISVHFVDTFRPHELPIHYCACVKDVILKDVIRLVRSSRQHVLHAKTTTTTTTTRNPHLAVNRNAWRTEPGCGREGVMRMY